MNNTNVVKFDKPKKIKTIDNMDNREILITFTDGYELKLFHDQDCCEDVRCINANEFMPKLSGETIVGIEKEIYSGEKPFKAEKYPIPDDVDLDSYTYSLFNIYLEDRNSTILVVFLGTSNGYYTEHADMDIYSLEEIIIAQEKRREVEAKRIAANELYKKRVAAGEIIPGPPISG